MEHSNHRNRNISEPYKINSKTKKINYLVIEGQGTFDHHRNYSNNFTYCDID